MPHLTLEYSKGLVAPEIASEVLTRLHAAMGDLGPFHLEDVKSRAVGYDTYVVAHGSAYEGSAAGFAHVTASILSGRDEAVRVEISAALLAVLRDALATALDERPCSLTVEIREMDRASYAKEARNLTPGVATPGVATPGVATPGVATPGVEASAMNTTDAVADVAGDFVAESRSLFAKHLATIERFIEPLDDEQIWWRPNEGSNSIGNLMLHLSGNVRLWIVGGIGGATVERDRQREFDERRHIPKAELAALLRSTIEDADRALAALDTSRLLERKTIQNREVSLLGAIYHVVEHFALHTGQITWSAKARIGDASAPTAGAPASAPTV